MSEVSKWDVRLKTEIATSDYLSVTGKKRIQLLSLLPSLATSGVGVSPYSGITNANQLNLRALASLHAGLTIGIGAGGQVDFDLVEGNMSLSNFVNDVPFLSTVDLTADVGATVLPVANGGTNLSTIPESSLLYTTGVDVIAAMTLNTNGALPIGGATGPVAAVPTSADSSVTITTGVGSLDFAVAFPNITGAVVDAQITSMDATKITGSILDAQITSLDGSKVTGSKVLDPGVLTSVTKLDSKYAQVANAADTVENTLASYTLPAGTLDADGEAIEIKAWGSFGPTANAKTIKLYVGGTSFVTNLVTVSPNGLEWSIEATVIKAGVTNSMCKGKLELDGLAGEKGASKHNITWAASNAVLVTGQNGVAAANEILFNGWTIKHFR